MGQGIGYSDCPLALLALCLSPREVGGDYKDWLKAERTLSLESLKDFGSPRQWYFKTSVLVGSKGVGVNRRVWGTFPIQGFYWAWKCHSVWAVDQLTTGMQNLEMVILLWWVLEVLFQHLVLWDKIKNIVGSWRWGTFIMALISLKDTNQRKMKECMHSELRGLLSLHNKIILDLFWRRDSVVNGL